MHLLHGVAVVTIVWRGIGGIAIAAAIALAARRVRALTSSGAAAAVVTGTLSFAFGGVLVAGALMLFFVSGSALSRIGGSTARAVRDRTAKSSQRDALQVLANGGVATLCAVIGGLAAVTGAGASDVWLIAAVSALAAAAGDTWSTEIGVLAHGPARHILSGRPVVAGISGGITFLGIAAAPLGGALVGLAGLFRPDILAPGWWIAIGAAVGLVGSVWDSILGAAFQGRWACEQCGKETENPVHCCGRPTKLVSGLSWLTNDAVNGLATLSGAALGCLLGLAMRA